MRFGLVAWLLAATACSTPPPAQVDGCVTCHEGIAQAHPAIEPGNCTVCHGGDAEATDKATAHVPIPADLAAIRGDALPPAPAGYIKDLPPDKLDQVDPAYLRFINPGDLRAAPAACGECHPAQVANVPTSIMTTNAGHYLPTRAYAGSQGRDAEYGSIDAVPAEGVTPADGAAESFARLLPQSEDVLRQLIADGDAEGLEYAAYDHYLAKNCNTCHAAGYGTNDRRGAYRSTGCSGCHMLYNDAGVYEGDDPTIARGTPVHVAKHTLTSAIPARQCATCHFQGGRIGLLFRGIREAGFADDPPNAEPWNEPMYGHPPGFYLLDEDTTNNVDETPPDAHYAAGMHCVDCHVGSDVHGDGQLWHTSKGQLDLRCEDCHGGVRTPSTPDGDGVFRTEGGRALPQLSQKDGNVVLTGRLSGREHIVPQPAELLAGGHATPYMRQAMGEDERGWSHTDSLTCDACHSSVQHQCLGCHVTLDLRLSQTDYQTGERSLGRTIGRREWSSIDGLLLARGVDGRAQPTNASTQVQMSIIDENGDMLLGERILGEDGEPTGRISGVFRENDAFDRVSGFAPFFQHTTSRTPRRCDACHRRDASAEELTRVRGVYGYGTGEFVLEAPGGVTRDALQFLDEEGRNLGDFIHPGTGPLGEESRARALGVILGAD